jgi:flagellar biosynthetic protein FliR
MEAILDNISLKLDLFILMFIRVSALIVSSPIFGRKTLPNLLKVCLCLVLTYVMFAANLTAQTPAYGSFIGFAVLCLKEMLFGLVLGYTLTLFFSLVQISGQYIDMQMGFGMVNVLDPQSNLNVPITGELLNIVLLVTFFGANGHLKLIYIINSTFFQIPVGTVALNPAIGMAALEVFILAFLLAVNVALPLIASGLLGEVVLGFITRAVPQVNVFVVGIPLKVILGFLMLLLVLPVYVGFTDVIFDRMFKSINTMMLGLAP